jgi:hypothetical protein
VAATGAAVSWACFLTTQRDGRRKLGERSTRQAAMNLADKPYSYGFAEVKQILANGRPGEVWQRKKGSWFKKWEAA